MISAITDMALATPLYHEIGHHIVRESGNHSEDTEKEAEKWEHKFGKRYMLRYHFLFTVLVIVIFFPFRKRLAKICCYRQFDGK